MTRIGELDSLRGLAAFGVMVFHYTTLYAKDIGHLRSPGFGFPAGNYGVQLFFVISGFVIFMTIEKTRTAMDFIVSRFSRLYPAYWAAVAVSAAFVYSVGLPEQRLPMCDLILNFTMIQEILHRHHLDGSYWTLQIELFFYIQVLLWFITNQLSRIHWIIALWLAAALGYYFLGRSQYHVSWTLGQLLILEQIPFFAIGILFYKIYSTRAHQLLSHAMIAACITVITVIRDPVYLRVALFCTIVFYLIIFERLRWLSWRPLAFLGTISYSLYLIHQVIGFDIIWHLEHDANVNGAYAVFVAISVSLLLATALTRKVEQPAMRWLRTLWKSRRLVSTQGTLP